MQSFLSILGLAVLTTTAFAQTPLPPNYKTILDNTDVQVMHVHYGAHEFVPMHDHPAVSTIYVYLNHSGEVDLIHKGPGAVTAHRPPTQPGAFRIAPGLAERHSVQSNSDTPSDFLRVELKRIPLPDMAEQGVRVAAPADPQPGIHTDFRNGEIRIDRIICPATTACKPFDANYRGLLIPLTPVHFHGAKGEHELAPGKVLWIPTQEPGILDAGDQALLVSFFTHE
jgi:quercetin dioxygenase-like cupin family protein